MMVKAVALAFALMTSFVSLAKPADKTVWRVGVFDGSSGEFAGGEPHGAVQFVAGQDQPRTAWYAFAPFAWAGKPAYPTSAPRSIDFPIAGRAEPVRYGQRPRSGRVELAIAGHTLSEPLHANQEFGEERIPFEAPEFAPDTQAKLTVVVNGHAAHVQETLQPQKKWTLLLVPHVHLDVGHTALSP